MIRMYDPIVATNQRKYVMDCIDSNMLTFHGSYVKRFEESLADMLGVKHCITTFNGSVSLYAILMGLKRQHKFVSDTIITPSMTYVATVNQILLAGFRPILTDCDSNFQIDLNQVEDLCKRRSVSHLPRLIVVPELYADMPNMAQLMELCDKHNLLLVEDSAETFGCNTLGRWAGTFGVAGSFSFFANKIITCGEGGCVVTNDDTLADLIRQFKNQGNIGYYRHKDICTNLRMTNIQAAIGLAQFEDSGEIVEKKLLTVKYYRDKLSYKIGRIVPKIEFSSEWMPVFKLPEGITHRQLDDHCKTKGFETRPGFVPVHLMEGFDDLACMDLRKCESMVDNHFILPCGPTLNDRQKELIVDTVNNFIREME